MPSCSMSSMRRTTTSRLSSFMFGMPYISSPPGRSSRSNTVTEWPARLSCAAAARPAGPEPMTATFLPVRGCGGSRHDPAFVPAAIDDRVLDVLDRDRRLVDAEHARAFARRRADAAGELREVVRLVQALERFVPQAAIDEVVPFRDQVVDRAARGHAADQLAGVAERHAAVHAARALLAQPLLLHVVMELFPVAHALDAAAVDRQLAQILDESVGLPISTRPARHLVSADAREVARVLFERDHDRFVAGQTLLVGARDALRACACSPSA